LILRGRVAGGKLGGYRALLARLAFVLVGVSLSQWVGQRFVQLRRMRFAPKRRTDPPYADLMGS